MVTAAGTGRAASGPTLQTRTAQSRLRRCPHGDWDAVGRARHVVDPHVVKEGHGALVTPDLATNADGETWASYAPVLDGHTHEFTDAVPTVKCAVERIGGLWRRGALGSA
jgi:hypothetical protein